MKTTPRLLRFSHPDTVWQGRRCHLRFILLIGGAGAPLGGSVGFAASKAVVNVLASPHVKFRPVDIDAAHWTGGFWGDRWETNRRVTVPTMKQVMELPTNSATFQNLRLAAGEMQGKFFGNNWSDGDCCKWIEAAASVDALTRDPELDRQMDEAIAVIAKVQVPDGSISNQIQLRVEQPRREPDERLAACPVANFPDPKRPERMAHHNHDRTFRWRVLTMAAPAPREWAARLWPCSLRRGYPPVAPQSDFAPSRSHFLPSIMPQPMES